MQTFLIQAPDVSRNEDLKSKDTKLIFDSGSVFGSEATGESVRACAVYNFLLSLLSAVTVVALALFF